MIESLHLAPGIAQPVQIGTMTEVSADERGPSLDSLCTEISARRHLVVVTNRGPVSFKRGAGGSPAPSSSGGFATAALAPLENRLPLTWISASSGDADASAVSSTPSGVFTGPPLPDQWTVRFAQHSRRVAHKHYNLVCNPLLWFLHHRTWGPSHTPNIDATVTDAWNSGHVAVSDSYRAEIERESQRVGRPLLLNTRDFTLPLLPGLVRASIPGTVILHSLDVPWPGPDWWQLLPAAWRRAIFRSLVSCDAISFATERDRRAFTVSAMEFVDDVSVGAAGTAIQHGGSETRLLVSPSGVDVDGLRQMSESPRVRSEARRLVAADGVHTFVTVERAEPHKNIVRAIRAFGRMLELAPGLSTKARYLLTLAPPPPHIGIHRRYLDEIRSAAADVNKRHGHQDRPPVGLQIERNYPKALAALTLYDTLVSVPLADGSLGSPVDGAIVNRRDGGLIVSEASPAADLLREAATIVSPTDIEGMAAAMRDSVEASPEWRVDRAKSARHAASKQTRERALERELAGIVDLV